MLDTGCWVLDAGELDVIKYQVSSIQYRSEATKVSSIGAKQPMANDNSELAREK